MSVNVLKASKFISNHGFSTRTGGVSTGIFDSLNLGMNRGDDKELVIENWNRFLEAAGIEYKEFVCGNQVHSAKVHIASKEDLRPAYGPGELIEADGYVTNIPGVPIAVFTADCVPILLEDSKNKVIGCLHAGWRGAVADIEAEGIRKMQLLGAEISEIKVAIGPAIDKCCFEVGEEVKDGIKTLLGEASSKYLVSKENGKYMADLRGTVKERFLELGVKEQNIEFVGGCTMCNPGMFWSHRYTKGERGSQASIISL